jgi:hypothetical protein
MTPNDSLDISAPTREQDVAPAVSRFKWLGWSSLFFAIVQSICTIFVVLSGVRLLLGAAAFTAAIGSMQVVDKIHADAIRVPMVMFALIGAVFNLVALWQVRRLRGRAASAWRQKTVPRGKFASEGFQLSLSLLTLALLAIETYFHFQHTGHF